MKFHTLTFRRRRLDAFFGLMSKTVRNLSKNVGLRVTNRASEIFLRYPLTLNVAMSSRYICFGGLMPSVGEGVLVYSVRVCFVQCLLHQLTPITADNICKLHLVIFHDVLLFPHVDVFTYLFHSLYLMFLCCHRNGPCNGCVNTVKNLLLLLLLSSSSSSSSSLLSSSSGSKAYCGHIMSAWYGIVHRCYTCHCQFTTKQYFIKYLAFISHNTDRYRWLILWYFKFYSLF